MSDQILYQEAAFPKESIGKVLKNYVSLLQKRTGLKIYGPKIPYILNLTGGLKGMRFFTSNKKSFRFNWKNNEIISASIWTKYAADPHFTVKLKGLNAVQVAEDMASILTNKKMKRAALEDSIIESKSFTDYWVEGADSGKLMFSEYKNSNEFKTAFAKTGVTNKKFWRGYNAWTKSQKNASRATYEQVRDFLDESDIKDTHKANIIKGKAGISIIDEQDPKALEFLASIGLKPGQPQPGDSVFKQIESYTNNVISGRKHSLIVAGDPGLGKCLCGSTEIDIQVLE